MYDCVVLVCVCFVWYSKIGMDVNGPFVCLCICPLKLNENYMNMSGHALLYCCGHVLYPCVCVLTVMNYWATVIPHAVMECCAFHEHVCNKCDLRKYFEVHLLSQCSWPCHLCLDNLSEYLQCVSLLCFVA